MKFVRKKKSLKESLFLPYTLLFIVSLALIFHYFPESGKRMVWKGDGLSQHYVALCYYARWGRSVLRSILAGRPAFPTLNMHIGFGSDLFTTLQYYVIGDPFSLPAVLVPQKYMTVFHDTMIFLRLYLAGFCFDAYCRYMGHRDPAGNLCGILVYVFCGFALFGIRHPYFLNAMIWFPLLLLGVEHILDGRKGQLFTLAVFFSCISNFYFFYMLVLMTVIYAVWRALRRFVLRDSVPEAAGSEQDPEPSIQQPAGSDKADKNVRRVRSWRELGLAAARCLLRALLGAAMGACFLLPVLLRFAQDPRAAGGTAQSFLYALSYYRSLPETFISFGTDAALDNWTCMGFGAVGLISVLLLFLNAEQSGQEDAGAENSSAGKKDREPGQGAAGGHVNEPANSEAGASGHTDLKIAFAGMVLLVALPAAGSALNGFSYPANRWIWAFAMLVGYITAVMLPSLFRISVKKAGLLLLLTAAFGAVCFALGAHRSTLAECLLAVAAVSAVTGLNCLAQRAQQRRRSLLPGAGAAADERTEVSPAQKTLSGRSLLPGTGAAGGARTRVRLAQGAVMVLTLLVTEAVHGYVEFIPGRMHSGIAEYHSGRYIEAMKASDAAGMRILAGNEPFYRYSGRDLANNFSLLHDVSNTQYYWSLSDSSVEQFFTETGQGNGMVHLYDNLDNRTFTDEIAGIRYYIRSDGSLLPFGYEKREDLHYDNREIFSRKEGDPLPVFSFSVYENQYALPFGFTAKNYISRDTYDGLTIPGRQEALMQGILLETDKPGLTSGITSGLPEADLRFTSAEIPFICRAEDGIGVLREQGDSIEIEVLDTEAVLSLEPEKIARREISVLFTGTAYLPPADKAQAETYSNSDPVTIRVKAERNGKPVSVKKVEYTLEDNPWRTGRSDFLSCCGYAEEPVDEIRLSFSRAGTYRFSKLQVIGQPMEEYPAQAEALRECVLEDLDLHELEGSGATSRITGKITALEEALPEEEQSARILCLQIPGLRGLKAFVDGEERQLLQADTMFSALILEPGTHEIELRYRTPGLGAGAAVSAAAVLFFLAEWVMGLRRRLTAENTEGGTRTRKQLS